MVTYKKTFVKILLKNKLNLRNEPYPTQQKSKVLAETRCGPEAHNHASQALSWYDQPRPISHTNWKYLNRISIAHRTMRSIVTEEKNTQVSIQRLWFALDTFPSI